MIRISGTGIRDTKGRKSRKPVLLLALGMSLLLAFSVAELWSQDSAPAQKAAEEQTSPSGQESNTADREKREQPSEPSDSEDNTNRSKADQDEAPAVSGSRLKLPPAVVNIEDTSEMRLKRDRAWYRGTDKNPDVNRLLEWQQQWQNLDPDFKGGTNRRSKPEQPKTGPGRRMSRVRLSYGLHDTLNAYLAAGQELDGIFYQAAYERFRSESVYHEGDTLPNSPRQKDDLHIDLGWSFRNFDLSATLRFFEYLRGLQTNTAYSQTRKNGLTLDLQGESFLGAGGRLRFGLAVDRGRQVLDHPQNSAETGVFTLRGNAAYEVAWPGGFSLSLGGRLLYENADTGETNSHDLFIFKSFAHGRLSFGIFTLQLGSDIFFSGANPALAAPLARLVMKTGDSLRFFVEARRQIRYMDFRATVLEQDYGIYRPLDAAAKRQRFGGGFHLDLDSAWTLSARADYKIWNGDYVPQRTDEGLYMLRLWRTEYLFLDISSHFAPADNFSLDLGFVKRFFGAEMPPYTSSWSLEGRARFRVLSWRTLFTLEATLQGAAATGSGDELGEYVLLDLEIRQPISEHASLFGEFNNILQAGYQIRDGYYEQGFSAHLGLSLRF